MKKTSVKQPVKILLTLDFPPEHGGIQRYLDAIVKHTFCADDVVIAPAGIPEKASDRADHYPCRVVRIWFPLQHRNRKLLLIPAFFVTLLMLLQKRHAATLYCGNIYTALVARGLSIFFPVPYHCYTYGTELLIPNRKKLLRHALWKALLGSAQTVYYLSGTTLALLRHYIDTSSCVQAVPKIALSDKNVHSKPLTDTIQLLSVGRLMPHKGHATLIEAFARLNHAKHHYHLSIAGDGPQRTHLEDRIRYHSLSSKVIIHTNLNDAQLSDLYHLSAVFIFPSIDTVHAVEGFGIVLLEAMAHRCAIICSDCSAGADVFNDATDCALFFKAGNTQELCNAIELLSADAARRDQLQHNAYTLLKDNYVWQ